VTSSRWALILAYVVAIAALSVAGWDIARDFKDDR
jgi:hypothetical protein